MVDRVGQVIEGKYRLIRLLGEGGMGSVYEAEHNVINRRCAVKFLHPEIATNPEVVARFTREAQAASSIRHKGIVDVYDVGTTADGAPFLVMEFLEGTSLGDLMNSGQRIPVTQLLGICVQALSALSAAHKRGIVHRDIKPDNIYLVNDDGETRVKLLDFGISKMTVAGSPQDRMTRTGTVLGTPYYMAPEQAAGRTDTDHRSDLYSIGVILYEALTGRVPFEGENYNQLILAIFTAPFIRPREIAPEIPEDVERIVVKAMERNRDDRYPDAESIIRDIVTLLGPETRQELNLPLRTTMAVQRLTRTPSPASASQLRTPTAQLTGTTGAGLAQTNAEPPPAKKKTGLFLGLGAGAAALLGVVLFLAFGRGGDDGAPAPAPAPPTKVATQTPPPEPVKVETPAPPAADAAAPVVPPIAPPPETPPDALAPPPPASEVVHIAFENLPAGAQVLWDGAQVAEVPFAVKKSEAGTVLEIKAEGFEPFRQLLVPSEDRTVALQLQPIRTPTGPTRNPRDAGSRPPPADAGSAAPPPPPPPPPERDAGSGIRTSFPGGDTPPRDAGTGGIRTTFP